MIPTIATRSGCALDSDRWREADQQGATRDDVGPSKFACLERGDVRRMVIVSARDIPVFEVADAAKCPARCSVRSRREALPASPACRQRRGCTVSVRELRREPNAACHVTTEALVHCVNSEVLGVVGMKFSGVLNRRASSTGEWFDVAEGRAVSQQGSAVQKGTGS